MTRPEEAGVFVIGYNQATGFPVSQIKDHNSYIDYLFNRNGKSCRNLYEQMRGKMGPSPTRKNINNLQKHLGVVGINNALETNVICYSTPMSVDLSDTNHTGGKEAGRAIFLDLLDIIRPSILIAHGAATHKELRRVLCVELPPICSHSTEGVSGARVRTKLRGKLYEPQIFVLPSLAPPKWNSWSSWAQSHMAETCAGARRFLDDINASHP